MISLDFETRGVVDLKKVGAFRYATDKLTQVLCMAWSYDREDQIRLWHRNHPWIFKSPPPLRLIERIRSGEPVEAHNAGFEFHIWNETLRREFPEFDVAITLEQLHCSAAKASCVSMPRALGDAVDAAGLQERKLSDGKRLIDKLSKPQFRRKKKKDKTWDIDDPIEPEWQWCEDEVEHRKNWEYCKQDIRAERGLSEWCPEMTPREREYWLMDQRMNMRGVLLDQDGAREALHLAARETIRLNNELAELTNGEVKKGSARKAFKTWVNRELAELGAEQLPDTKADTLSRSIRGTPTKASDDVIKRVQPMVDEKWSQYGERGEDVRRAMTISMEVNQTSVSKFSAMMKSVARDGRCHDIMLYNGAGRTGRWAGKGIQPHNFVRGYKEEMPIVWDDIMSLPPEVTMILWDEPLKTLAKACRGAFVAAPGREFYAADFNAIEARKLAWMSNCASQLLLFNTKGGDPYIDMAEGIYKVKLNKFDNPNERNLGKRAVLGLGYCLAADTLVLTKRGWVRIDCVVLSDMLWDGCEWVSHRGLTCNGEKFVMNLDDTFLTTDHPVLCGDQFHLAEKVDGNGLLHCLALETGAEALPLLDMLSEFETESGVLWSDVIAENRNIKSTWQIGDHSVLHVAHLARSVRQRIDGMGSTEMQWQTLSIANDCLIALQRLSRDVITRAAHNSKITALAASKFAKNGIEIEQHFYGTSKQSQDGIIRTLKLIEKTMIEVMSLEIFDSQRGQNNASIRAGQKENVYDLIDAGPRHRYTILMRNGPMIVHNSMGWEKFQSTVWAEEGIWLDDEFCQMIVDVYRKEKCPEVPRLWKATNEAAIAAVVEGGEHWAGGDDDGNGAVKYFIEGRFLHCQLPSGRYLAYLDPRVRTRVTWRFKAVNASGKKCFVTVPSKTNVSTQRVRREAERLAGISRKTLTNDPPKNYVAPHLSFMGQDQKTRQWKWLGTHGGTLVENYDQASSRDLLAEAMYRVDQDDRFDLLLSIHDEVIAEGDRGCCTLKEFEDLMAVVPAWAPGMPIKAEGWISGRLRK